MKKTGFWFLIIIFSALACCITCSLSVSASEFEKVERGEMNNDEKYSLRDALIILKQAALIEDKTEKADVNLDGIVDVNDARIIFELALNQEGTYGFYTYKKPEHERTLIVDNQAYSLGDYCFHSLEEAFKFADANAPASEEERITIKIAPGTYREQVILNAPYITIDNMFGQEGDRVLITWYFGCGNYYTGVPGEIQSSTCPAFMTEKTAIAFTAENIDFENSYNIYTLPEELEAIDPVADKSGKLANLRERFTKNDPTISQTQALAVFTSADKAVFKNCSFYGRQDTLKINSINTRSYFENCYIEGTVDFIYGQGTAVFKDCHINCPYNSGYITAAKTPIEADYGFLFYNCKITKIPAGGKSAPADASYSLGRNWGIDAMVVYWDCFMDSHIKTGHDRWVDMDGPVEQSRFAEIGTMDLMSNKLDLNSIVDTSRQKILNASDMALDGEYAAWKWLWGNDSWNPAGFDTITQ